MTIHKIVFLSFLLFAIPTMQAQTQLKQFGTKIFDETGRSVKLSDAIELSKPKSEKAYIAFRLAEGLSDGRTNDIIKLPSGKISPGLTFYYISKKLLESGGRIKEFIIIQKTMDTFLFKYVANDELSASEKIEIQKAMDLYLEPGLICEFLQCEFIERTKAGKLKHFFSEVS